MLRNKPCEGAAVHVHPDLTIALVDRERRIALRRAANGSRRDAARPGRPRRAVTP
jgi:hypothetical protein